MFTAKCPASWNAGRLGANCERLQRMSGGESETELKEFAVNPANLPFGARVVMMVTPVTNVPSAARKSFTSIGAVVIRSLIPAPDARLQSRVVGALPECDAPVHGACAVHIEPGMRPR